MKQSNKIFFASGLTALAVLSACTKELPYKEVLKEEVQAKAQIDTNSEYLYTSSMLNASRNSADALPFSASQNMRVKLQWTKDALRVIEVEKDARFQGNTANNKLVLEIPVEHIDYQCTKDKYGECTSSEEENKDVSWSQKGKFKFKLEAAKSGTLDLLPILIDKTFGGKCYEEISSKVLKTDVEENAINLEIERTFKTACLGMGSEISDSSVTAVYHYSMAKVSSVTTKDFKPVSYPSADQSTFGFFTTEKSTLAVDNTATESGQTVLMNHWNPNRTEIVYYLSDEFAKPENAMIKDLTYKTVANLNAGLEISGAKFRINLKDPAHKNPGDIRNSMIVLVEDPVASSIIGYGPQTEDPATGEIVSARTVMFLGSIKKYIRVIYDGILNEKRRMQAKKVEQGQDADPAGNDNGGLIIENGLRAKIAATKKLNSKRLIALRQKFSAAKAVSSRSAGSRVVGIQNLQMLGKDLRQYTKRNNSLYKGAIKAQYKYLQEAKNCAFGLNAELPVGNISPRLASQFPDDAKPWDSLSEAEMKRAMDIILPEVWIPTLIHEMGHNLGLRHNFAGSEDKANFYSEQELAQLGIDHKIPFSTVMEYGDDLKALPVLGKYDIAALKFAYVGKLELKDKSVVDVKGSISKMQKENEKLELKNYEYCTDEHTGINAGCRRFDLGTNYTEIVQNEIQGYWDRYNARAFRHGKASMSLVEDFEYAQGIKGRFMGLRLMQEIYERFKNEYGLDDENPAWNDPKTAFLGDLKQASLLAGQFLLKVLKTPDQTCLIAKQGNLGQIVTLGTPAQFGSNDLSCFDMKFPEAKKKEDTLVVIGQYGKSFQSKKDPKSENHYADQIDLRGYWIDKLMATRVLFERETGSSSLDRYSDNFADRSDLKPELVGTLMEILLNQVNEVQEVETVDGNIVMARLPTETFYSHVIEKPLFTELAQAMKIPDQSVSFTQVLASEVAKNMLDADHMLSGKDLYDAVRVTRARVTDGNNVKGFQVLDIGADRLIASPDNLAGFMALNIRQMISFLDTLKKEKVAEILKQKQELEKEKKPLPDVKKLPKDEQIVWSIPSTDLEAYLAGALGTPAFYQSLIMVLPN